jgi:hypothetical protein
MDFRLRAIYLLLPLALLSGCRHNAVQREQLEADLLWQENRIYELEAQLRDARRVLDGQGDAACPPSSGGLPSFLDRSTGSSTFRDAPVVTLPGTISGPTPGNEFAPHVELPGTPSGTAPPPRSTPVLSPPDATRPEGAPGRGIVPMPPATETSPMPPPMSGVSPVPMSGASFGGPAASSSSRFAAPTRPVESVPFRAMSSPKFRAPNARGGTSAPAPGTPSVEAAIRRTVPEAAPTTPPQAGPPPADQNIAAITLHRRTGGWNADGKPGDEGITVVVEPRNARGQLIPTSGAVSIALIDPEIPGDGGRYARLDFTAEDAQALQRSSNVSGGGEMQIEVPWPDAPPAHAKLRVFVRFTTADGRKLQADREVTVDLRGSTRQALATPPGGESTDPREPGMLPGAETSAGTGPLYIPPPPIPQGETIVGPVLMGPTLIAPAEVPAEGTPVEAVPATADAPGAWKRR